MLRTFLLTALLAAGLLPAGTKSTPKKSAFDKPTFEAYVRHLFVWGPQITMEVGDPKPSPIPGFQAVKVHASAGNASQDELFHVSKDGQQIIRGSVFDIAQNPFKRELEKLNTQGEPAMGTPGAPVVIVEFSDFQCPYCKEEAKVLRTNLISTYPKEVRLYFKTFPLAQIHNWAKPAAIAAHCIYKLNPDLFWDYHDWIFEHQTEVTLENLKDKVMEFAKDKQVDALKLSRCIDTKETEAEVDKTIAEAQALGVGGTPTLFVNGRQLVGQQAAWASLRPIIDYEIEYQKTAKNAGEDCGCEIKLSSAPAK